MKLVELKEGRGIVGATINLNLAQCQKLKQLHTRINTQLEVEDKEVQRVVSVGSPLEPTRIERLRLLEDLNKFLSLFENFQHPDDEDLWQDSKDDFDSRKY